MNAFQEIKEKPVSTMLLMAMLFGFMYMIGTAIEYKISGQADADAAWKAAYQEAHSKRADHCWRTTGKSALECIVITNTGKL